jgi:hypothetical protein
MKASGCAIGRPLSRRRRSRHARPVVATAPATEPEPLWRAAANVADLLLADDAASIEEHGIEPLARTIRQFSVDHGIVLPEDSEANPDTAGFKLG